MISVFDIFKVGVGPSSSHTVGPMRAAGRFLDTLRSRGLLERVERVRVHLYGSLALTGHGHATDRAVLAGLGGAQPQSVDPDAMLAICEQVAAQGRLRLAGEREIVFDLGTDLLFHYDEILPAHPNGMRFEAFGAGGGKLAEVEYFSIGGGFVMAADEMSAGTRDDVEVTVPFPFRSGADLLAMTASSGLRIDQLVWRNERTWRDDAAIRDGLNRIWEVMQKCVDRGLATGGVLPGKLAVRRRAARMYQDLEASRNDRDANVLEYVNAFALAVNEENAAGGRVVTAPTNGAAGIVPAVAHYYRDFIIGADDQGVRRMLLTAGALAILYKKNASISGAEMGCQGEVGVACSMAAGGLAATLGATPAQVENAAEIGMEHNLGLTCDPVGGLVQIPCIERNAMGSVKAINAARLALRGDGEHKVSLDQVIATMRQTGKDMSSIYKETSQGGLAVNVVEC